MKKSIVISVLISMTVVLAVPAYAGLAPDQTQIKAYWWFRYTYKQQDNRTQESGFAAKRGYLRWEHCFAPDISSRVTLDLFSSDKKEDPHGAGLKIKDAYVDFKGVIPEGKITVGVQKHYFGLVYDWDYVTIEKSFTDKNRIAASRDLGICAGGNLPQGYGEWNLELVNGEGYKKVGKNIDTNPALVGNLRLIPIPGVTVGGSFHKTSKKQNLAAVGRLVFTPIDVWGIYVTTAAGKDLDKKGTGFMLMPIVNLSPKVDAVFRFDRWDPDTDKADDAYTLLIGGINYHFVKGEKGTPGVMLQLNFERKQPEKSGSKPTDELLAQLRWEFTTPGF